MGNTFYPSGDGHPDCPDCRGRGVVPIPKERRPTTVKIIGEITQPCHCVLARDVITNLERGWKSLSRAEPIKTSPLLGKTEKNLWVTASNATLKKHIKHTAARMEPRWNFLVRSDADLMDAWLSKGLEVTDPDIDEMRQRERRGTIEKSPFEALSELVEYPTLLIIVLGVKVARNKAMPEVLMEALNLREFVKQPTWLVDQPVYPLAEGHIDYSPNVERFIEGWEHVLLDPMGIQTMSMESETSPVKKPPRAAQQNHPAFEPGAGLDADAELQRLEDSKRKERQKNWKKKGREE